MYANNLRNVSYRGIATLLTLTLVFWAVGVHMFYSPAEAANLTKVKDTLSDSAPGSVSDHEFQFSPPNGIAVSGTVTITFPSEFNVATSGIDVNDVDFEIDGVDETVVAGAPAANQWGFSTTSNDVIFTSGGGSALVGANATVTIKIGTNADGPGVNQVTNPTATTSYEFTIVANSTDGVDSGQLRVAIIDNVLVTANVNTTLTFTVSGTSTGATINGSPTTTFAGSTDTTLPFGTLDADVSKVLGQDLTVATNAKNGYVVTVEQDTQLQSTTGADIDGFVDGAWDTVPASWTSPSNDINNEDTWGHWGLTSTDGSTTRTSEFGSDQWVAASTTPIVIMGHTGPADGVTDAVGRATIGYQIQITALQEAGDDYETTLTYIATPTF